MTVQSPIKRCEPTTWDVARAMRRERTDEILTEDSGQTFFTVNAAYAEQWRSREMTRFLTGGTS